MANNKVKAVQYENLNNANMQRANNIVPAGGATSGSTGGSAVYTGSNPYMYAYNNGIKQRIKAGYNTQIKGVKSAKNAYFKREADRRNAWRGEQATARNDFRTRAAKEQAQSVDQTNTGYDASAKQNYINYMRAQKNLPSQLNALGIRGGASESSAIRLNTNYGSNVAANETARNTALAELRRNYEKALADYDVEYAQRLSSYDDEYRGRLGSYEDTYAQRLGEIRANRANAITNAYTTAKENDLTYKKERREANLANYKESIVGKWKTKEGYKKEIARLKKSKDPNKWQKIWFARQAMNQLKDDGGSGGGGGGRSYGGGGSYGGSGGGDNSYNANIGSSVSSAGSAGSSVASAFAKSAKGGNKGSGGNSSKPTTSGRNRRSISRGNGLWY